MGIRYVFFCILIFFSMFISSGHVVTASYVCGVEKVNCSVNDRNLTGVLSKKNLSDSEHESQIKYLNLSRNKITGIDGDLWELLGKLLITLDLSFNKIETFPTSNIDKLKSLKTLNLSSNQISELEVSKFSQLQSLTSLDVSLNNLQVNLKSGDKFHNLSHLNLAGNNLSWKSLESLGKISKLIHLNISDSKLSGKDHTAAISNNITKLIHLTHLDLSKNNLNETSFQGFEDLSNLVFLDVSDAGLHQSVSLKEILKLGNLTNLILSRNNYDSLDDLTSTANTSKLEYLDLSSNNLTGSTPLTEIFANFSKLNSLDLSNNSLNGSAFLAEILKLGNLTKLDLSCNSLGGNDSFSKAPVSSNLIYLDLSDNNLSGSKFITEILADLSKLSFLDLSNNYLRGQTIFAEMLKLENLTKLNLSSNNLGPQNSSNKALVSSILQHLDLSGNNLTGPIPTEILELKKLTLLNLSRNSFSGNISNFTRLPDLQVLDLSHNNLTGNISDPLKKKMEEMGKANVDISGNRICIGNDSFLLSIGGSTGHCPDNESPAKKKGNGAWKIALGVILPILIITMLIIFLAVTCRRRKNIWGPSILRHPRSALESRSGPLKFETGTANWCVDIKLATSVPVVIIDKPFLQYTFADLFRGTSGFNRESLVDEERFGLIYTGKLPDGHKISINVLDHETRLADDEVAKYLERIGSMNHPNLAPLIGYCILKSQKIVIYDYMENGNLHDLLQEASTNNKNSDDEIPESRNTYAWIDEDNQIHNRTYVHQGQDTWIFRHRIALGVARGLAYLHKGHSLEIVHGNVRSRNIFLDSTFAPRLSNYGLDKLDAIEDDENPNESMLMEVVATTESDVYDFGVLLFELVTGRNDVEWIRELVKKNTLPSSEVIDRKIRSSGDEKEMLDGLKIGYLCTSEVASKRPSMQHVIGLLKDIEPSIIMEFPN